MAQPIISDLAQLPAPPPARRPEPYGSESRAYSPASGSESLQLGEREGPAFDFE
jgi:hypothetical protein